jgi:hypothetical protein
MKTFKPSETEARELRIAAAKLEVANKALGEAKKNAEAAKEQLGKWLKAERELDLATLGIGEMILIEDVVLIEIGKQARFDEKAFLLAEPAKHAEFKKDLPILRYKPIINA